MFILYFIHQMKYKIKKVTWDDRVSYNIIFYLILHLMDEVQYKHKINFTIILILI